MPSLAPAWLPNFIPLGKLSWQNPDTTAINFTRRFGSIPFSRALLEVAAHFAHNHNGFRLRIVFKHLKVADVIRTRVGIATDPDRRRNAVGELRTDPNDFIRETTRLGNDAERSFSIAAERTRLSNAPPITPRRQAPAEIIPIEDGPLKTLPSLRAWAPRIFASFSGTLSDHWRPP